MGNERWGIPLAELLLKELFTGHQTGSETFLENKHFCYSPAILGRADFQCGLFIYDFFFKRMFVSGVIMLI